MKLSIAWIFDHIKASWKDIDINALAARISSTTAEIENVRHVKIDLDQFTLVSIVGKSNHHIITESFELKKEIDLPDRKDLKTGELYLVKKNNKHYAWASLIDIGSEKEGLLGPVYCSQDQLAGAWKHNFETEDYILELDNKAITHRPDLWGHRGFAREIAALLDKELRAEDMFLAAKLIKHYTHESPVSAHSLFTIDIAQENNTDCQKACRRIAGIELSDVTARDSQILMAHRLARIDARPIDALVDATNYVMFDIGYPLHAFDAQKINTHKIVGRCARAGEKLELLDGETVELANTDYVISDGVKPIALAGIMGGLETAVTSATKSVFVEAGNFDPSVIRKTATRIKKRTEASTRFEKSLDPNQNTQAILRFLKVLEDIKLQFKASDAIISVGQLSQETVITLTHELLVARIGIPVNPEFVEKTLQKLGFGVQLIYPDSGVMYAVTVPTYRATKDIALREDIIEEVVRFIGYDTILHNLPMRHMAPFETQIIRRTDQVKRHMAYALNMHEAQTYAFFDEPFLHELKWEPAEALRLQNPFSEHIQRIITSLVPNLLKCIVTNKAKQEQLRFFELNRIWFQEEKIVERKALAGIFYEHKKTVDFYESKALLNSLFTQLGIDIIWQKPTQKLEAWYNKYQTAELRYKERVIGIAGIAATQFLKNIADGQAFIFELDADFILEHNADIQCFKPLLKYQEVKLDISVLVSHAVTSAELERIILYADQKIIGITLIDFFERKEWGDQKSLTYNFTVYDEHKTLTKEEIDSVWNNVVSALQKQGAQIR
jgi:phenylalanyl-tRNA synthetase beta chain